jgi:hypothetical protein
MERAAGTGIPIAKTKRQRMQALALCAPLTLAVDLSRGTIRRQVPLGSMENFGARWARFRMW